MLKSAATAALLTTAAVAGVGVPQAPAAGDAAGLCEIEIARAEREYEIPQGLLRAIALVESGRGGRPWPWTIGEPGAAHYAPTREAAAREARQRIAQGRRSIDLGCLQVNWRWHGERFPDPEWVLEPRNNTDYAAWYLAELRRQHGSWTLAVARYHASDTARRAQAGYLCRVLTALGAPTDECTETPR